MFSCRAAHQLWHHVGSQHRCLYSLTSKADSAVLEAHFYSLHRACAACIAIGQLVLRLRGASTAVGSLVLAVSINPSLYMVLTAGHVLGTDTERQNLQRVQISARR